MFLLITILIIYLFRIQIPSPPYLELYFKLTQTKTQILQKVSVIKSKIKKKI